MLIPHNLIVNADDIGLNPSVTKAILYCFEQGYINSTSLITNTAYFDDTVKLIAAHSSVQNIGVHINLAEGKPVSGFDQQLFLDDNGDWDFIKVNKKIKILNKDVKIAFTKEIHGQIEKALDNKILINHLDSHCHLHTLPGFLNLFVVAAKRYKLKLRPAQSYYEGKLLNFTYRKFINFIVKLNNIGYTNKVESINYFLKSRKVVPINQTIEVVLHPDFSDLDLLTDHVDGNAIAEWINYLKLTSKDNKVLL